MKLSDLTESAESKNFGKLVNASHKAYDTLSYQAQSVLTEWESANWDTGSLSQSHASNNEVMQEISQAFAPVRALMHQLFGETIRLHRGQRAVTPDRMTPNRQLFSFTFSEKVAKDFVFGTHKFRDIPSIEDIKAAVKQYERLGFVTFDGSKYKKSKEYPGYFNIYDSRNNHITDGKDLEEWLMRTRSQNIESQDERKAGGQVHTIDVPIDKIIWITNRLNSKEFIVALNPLKQ